MCFSLCNYEGSIVVKTGSEDLTHSQAAVLANICNEYIDFGHEAFNNNTFQAIFISMDSGHLIARPVYNLILCFICDSNVNLGLIKNKLDVLAESITEGMKGLKEYLTDY